MSPAGGQAANDLAQKQETILEKQETYALLAAQINTEQVAYRAVNEQFCRVSLAQPGLQMRTDYCNQKRQGIYNRLSDLTAQAQKLALEIQQLKSSCPICR